MQILTLPRSCLCSRWGGRSKNRLFVYGGPRSTVSVSNIWMPFRMATLKVSTINLFRTSRICIIIIVVRFTLGFNLEPGSWSLQSRKDSISTIIVSLSIRSYIFDFSLYQILHNEKKCWANIDLMHSIVSTPTNIYSQQKYSKHK